MHELAVTQSMLNLALEHAERRARGASRASTWSSANCQAL
jgi:Zn finger protein HypA/HybF involved in hydrogenase expression